MRRADKVPRLAEMEADTRHAVTRIAEMEARLEQLERRLLSATTAESIIARAQGRRYLRTVKP